MKENINDPVKYLLEALESGTNKETALEQAKKVHQYWWALDASDSDFSMVQLKELLKIRTNVFALIASVYMWNEQYNMAFEIEDQFLYHTSAWEGDDNRPIDIYLSHLLFQKQTDHLKEIFKDINFKNEFPVYQDIYLSMLNPNYEFKSDQGEFLDIINHLNAYARVITGIKLL